MIEQFKNGATLITGKDIQRHFEKVFNRRNNYDKNCSFCKYEDDYEIDRCGDCSLESGDMSCSCHINPPCSKCVNSAFEPSQHLINYKHYRVNGNGKWRWECFRSDKDTWEVFNKMEADGWELSAETLTNGVIAIYLEKNIDEFEEIELCGKKVEFKNTVIKFIDKINKENKV